MKMASLANDKRDDKNKLNSFLQAEIDLYFHIDNILNGV